MFKSLFGAPKPVYDPALGDPIASQIIKEAEQGKIATLLLEDKRLRTDAWDQRAFYVELAGKYLNQPSIIQNLPDTPMGNLLKGSSAINLAWEVRGRGSAETVTDKGATQFVKYLNYALQALLRAADQDRDDPTGLAFLQTVAMGLGLERRAPDTWFQEAVRRDPLNQQAHYRHLFLMLKKWGGSHEEMYAFARATMAKTPQASTLYPILYLAFQEHYLFLLFFDNNKKAANAFLSDKAIREESVVIYKSSLAKLNKIQSVSDYWPHNVAVWWFMALDIPEIVREETKKIGPYFTEFPWRVFYGRDPAAGYQKALNM